MFQYRLISFFNWERVFGKFLTFGVNSIPLYRKGFAKTEKDEDCGSMKITKQWVVSCGESRSVVNIQGSKYLAAHLKGMLC